MPIKRFLLLTSLLVLALPAAAVAAPTAVDVRIEGKTSTIFSGPVTTDGKAVTSPTGGTHTCDGTNMGAHPTPGPTAISALDDAAIKGGFDWDGPWFGPDYLDYFVTRVAGESETSTEFWGVFVNGTATTTGGCQVRIAAGDEVLWTFDAFNKVGALTLSAPASAHTGEAIATVVRNRATGAPVAGAAVGSATSGADGKASLSFDEPDVYRLKAEKAGFIRSSEARVCVDPPLVEACTSTDRTAPSVRLDAPAVASSVGRFGFIRLSWQGDDGATGSGVRRYRVEKRRIDVSGGAWRAVATDTAKTLARVPARAGSAYEFRVQAIDRAGNASPLVSDTTLMPVDNLSHRLRFSTRGWKTLRRQGAFKLSVSRATRAGALAKLRFTGTRATVVTRGLPAGGRVRITVDGDSKVVDLRGRGGFRTRSIATKTVERGPHTLRVVSLRRSPVEIDAVAITP
jgi:hypothetical protein